MKKLLITFIIHIFFIQAWGQNENEIKLANEYFMEGQFDKAEVLFEKLSKNKSNIPEIHSNYITLLFNKADYKTAEKYLIKIVDIFPATIQYHADLLYLYYLSENHAAKDKYFALLIASFSKNQYQLSAFAQNLVGKGMLEDARNCFLEARKISGNSRTYSLELASVYRLKNDKPSMTEEYLNYAMANPRNILYIQNIFQTLLNNEDDLDFLEETLIRNVQKDPDQLVYVDLLIWVELQRKNFYGAFIQAKAKDKRL
ncbi:MAG: hypothetical protein OEY51_13835, partial [Cyclobacteriaceae bacterium]|nr:hypothetical protein [Cyclobacteriaceae bacterium]